MPQRIHPLERRVHEHGALDGVRRPSLLAAAAFLPIVVAHRYPPEVRGHGWGKWSESRNRHRSTVRECRKVRRATWPPPQKRTQRLRLGTSGTVLQESPPVPLTRRRVHGIVREGIGIQIGRDDARSESRQLCPLQITHGRIL